MEEYKLSIDENGNVSSEREQSERERNSKLSKIHELIQDETTPPAKIKRLIAEEINSICMQMIGYSDDVSLIDGMRMKALETQVKSLRELGKEIMDADTLSHKDFLNIDGKKFKFVLGQIVECMKEAMRAVKLDETTANSVLSNWRDIMAAKDEDIRRDVEKLDSKK
jgi:hypothetical protein